MQGKGGTDTGRSLFAMLVSDSNEVPTSVLTDEQWDSSTVSSAVDSSHSHENSAGDGEGVYFKSTSGFSVRL